MSCEVPVTGIPMVDAVLVVLGALSTIATVLGNWVPGLKDSKAGALLRRVGVDLRPTPPVTP